MKNLDLIKQKKKELFEKISQAVKDGDAEGFSQAWEELYETLEEAVVAQANGMIQAADTTVLSGRGVRQLTSEETDFYQKTIDAMKTSNPKQALTDLDVVMPKTVIDAVFEDLTEEHPLLNAIGFQNTSGLIEILVNNNGNELATWSALTSEIVKELTSGFKKVNLQLTKLSAFLPVAKSMLDLGPEWLDRYVRAILGEALAYGLEEGIINGTGKNMPIGMNRQVGEGVTVTDGEYPKKATVALDNLDPVTYGELISGLTLAPNGKRRKVSEVIMIVNPVDYLRKVMPATTIRAADGSYVKDVLPFPTKIIQSTRVEQGMAIIGLGRRYFMGVGTAKSGKIEYSDDYRFLEDERVYLVKLYGHGEPLDNNAFVYADISNLKPAYHKVYIANTEGEPVPIYDSYDARLDSLAIGSLTLSPVFNKSTHAYTADTTNATNTITALAVDDDATIEILVNGVAHTNGDAATWNTGENTVLINVASGTETESYTVIVTKS